jgi:cytochrome c oxidase accessory protein FixG
MEGHRVYLYPEDVRGIWKDRRTFVYIVLILIYLVLPWIYFNGEQAIRLDLPARELHVFGNLFYAHDAPMILLLLLGFVFSIGFITSLWGRVWCGWACPQTVFIDPLYRQIERLIEGRARERMKLDQAPWNFNKLWKRGLKWFLFLVVSLHIAHSLLGYFVGTHELLAITMQSPAAHPSLFITMLVITGVFLFDFGWFREQFCIIACPYGRMQSVIMDQYSKIVGYDYNRGEPRRAKETPKDQEGDCINCYHCVKVCPTGIDIRNGTQLECIACTACIDACDEIMEKVHKPKGLIRFTSEAELENLPPKKFSFRSTLYLTIILVITGVFIYVLSQKNSLNMRMVKLGKSSYRVIDESTVNNLYRVNFDNKTDKTYAVTIKANIPEVVIKTRKMPFIVNPGEFKTVMHLNFPQSILKDGEKQIILNYYDKEQLLMKREVKLVGPFE